jgi:hypothetical protein
MPLPLETPVQMPNTSTAIDPTPINSTARATGSYSSECQKRESIRRIPVQIQTVRRGAAA